MLVSSIYLRHLLSVGFGIEWGLSEQDGVLLGSNSQLVVEGVVPDLLHVVPVGDDSVLDGVFQGEDTSLGLSLIADVRVFLSHSNHDALMPGATDDRREHSSGSVVSGKSSLAHSGSIVNNKGGDFVFHFRILEYEIIYLKIEMSFAKPKKNIIRKRRVILCVGHIWL